MQLEQKNVLLGISGGIAAYKTPDLVRKLVAAGAKVRVVMTDSAKEFVSPLALQAVSGNKISNSLLDEDAEAAMGHIELARWADIFLIAPATANVMAKLSHGLADDLLTTLALATPAPIVIAPAMNQQMWAAPATSDNINILNQRGVNFIGPASGEQACGDVGYGRMVEPEEIVSALGEHISHAAKDLQLFAGKNIMITAGPTREALDPVRYITNHSSGKMGYAIAEAAEEMGATVTLVSGPVNISAGANIRCKQVISAQNMLEAVMSDIATQDIFIACAAVADFRLAEVPTHKVKKKDETLTLSFEQNPDILKTVAALKNKPFTLGFAAETNDVEAYARSKLSRKNLDMIAANDVSSSELGFNSDRNALTVITKNSKTELAPASKKVLAQQLLTLLHSEYTATQQ
ncbi:bifunctional phosphopantothenoylcysteine decarboxylase/phosphopantothenate--cysteine ligase CoaBC [Glaciecola sp. MH2013]|uniref:bifunctional phosphopantothenoylcysteine decarboxylase/phosphopantothenate--cysteine ligase CoaBC n=1 Tax=Glaciecola sp. MH2013 TaxID=2785524 RepID=UPI00189D5114|nr:bifunctional phosphopantothenoylcysteine decarboxylase/phosphopantothenate--cysteine ligase CoaBC [Glaciecola sp. MH2013]MBF7073357.1 bifunctional phosphopantothenoylcysteine decarboxylase/phosphopantothenate--cysteine ligase CoaBC [Glaciecola sp. MH2013]